MVGAGAEMPVIETPVGAPVCEFELGVLVTVDLRGPVDDTAAFPIRDDQPVSAAESLADAPREAP
jgi:hypothetical protein